MPTIPASVAPASIVASELPNNFSFKSLVAILIVVIVPSRPWPSSRKHVEALETDHLSSSEIDKLKNLKRKVCTIQADTLSDSRSHWKAICGWFKGRTLTNGPVGEVGNRQPIKHNELTVVVVVSPITAFGAQRSNTLGVVDDDEHKMFTEYVGESGNTPRSTPTHEWTWGARYEPASRLRLAPRRSAQAHDRCDLGLGVSAPVSRVATSTRGLRRALRRQKPTAPGSGSSIACTTVSTAASRIATATGTLRRTSLPCMPQRRTSSPRPTPCATGPSPVQEHTQGTHPGQTAAGRGAARRRRFRRRRFRLEMGWLWTMQPRGDASAKQAAIDPAGGGHPRGTQDAAAWLIGADARRSTV
ncbi:hypothetical protein B0H19DRAFT_1061282 [Mycena capillaripes]|nr:hypothetical protein B0H19DRAFT_1061282 [Mycena capillaripes]